MIDLKNGLPFQLDGKYYTMQFAGQSLSLTDIANNTIMSYKVSGNGEGFWSDGECQ